MNLTDSQLAVPRPMGTQVRVSRHELALSDGYRTPVYEFAPPEGAAVKAAAVLLHGIQSHPGWFAGLCESLAATGVAVTAPTRRGSGENTNARGHAASADVLLEDVETVCRHVAQSHGRAVSLVGISWGGKLAAAYAAHRRRSVEVDSLTLVAPGLAPKVDLPMSDKLSVALSLLVAPQRHYPIPLSDVDLFTDNEPMRQYLRGDRHRLHVATARMLYANVQLDSQLRSTRRGSLGCRSTLILASRDRIINNVKTRRLVERLTAGRAEVVELDGSHTLEFEAGPEPSRAAVAAGVLGG